MSPPRLATIAQVDPGTSEVAADGARDLALLERVELELEDVDRALRRLDEGSYATCEACGQPIGEDRLAASPLTRRCAEHDPTAVPLPSAGI